ncbi:MAG: TadE/TadG family type IV pilus assembly protein [Smithella sp.]|nr:TadE/TadG family type IV pilus assembly protein [Smithella sp.]
MKKLNERGVSAVEFALLLPVLVVIVFGIIEFGFILYDKQVITSASREVARAAIVRGANVTDINSAHEKYRTMPISFVSSSDLSAPSILTAKGTSDCTSLGTDAFGTNLTVTYTYEYEFLALSAVMGLIGGNLDSSYTLQGSTTMRCE